LLALSASEFSALTTESVTILRGNHHWVTAAGTADGVIYMDSLRPHQQITAYVARQLLQLFATLVDDQGKLRIKIVPSTSQSHSTDCGIFAASYAAEIVAGSIRGVQSPFDVWAMRQHLEQCLVGVANSSVSMFPSKAATLSCSFRGYSSSRPANGDEHTVRERC